MEYKLTLNTDKSDGRFTGFNAIVLRQNDALHYKFRVEILENGVPFNLTDCVVRFYATKPDGNMVIDPAEIISPEQGVVLYSVPKELTQVTGTISLAYFQVSCGDGVVASTEDITISVKPGGLVEALSSGLAPEIDAILNLLEEQRLDYSNRWNDKEIEINNLLDSIREAIANGDFKGDKGDQGDQGEPGQAFVTELGGYLVSFQIRNDGILWLICDDEDFDPDSIGINQDGYLVRYVEQD